jgi:hypothetical protein
MRAREVLAGIRPERRLDISETRAGDDSVKVDRDVPAASEPDQIIRLVMHHQAWLKAPGQPEECLRENDDAVNECEDIVSGLSSRVKQSLTSREPQKEDKSEVLQCLMDGKQAGWEGEYKI